MLPVWFELSQGSVLSETGRRAVWVGPTIIAAGLILLFWAFQRPKEVRLPAPVRMAITGNVCFLSFCALEFSDGLVRQNGRVFYWTTFLFLPALLLLYGLASTRRWAWWSARCLVVLFAFWFLGSAFVIPFAHVQSHGETVPFWGRVWMIGVSLLFAGAAGYVFRALSHDETRRYFGIARSLEPGSANDGGSRDAATRS
jgi:hypothetical protein